MNEHKSLKTVLELIRLLHQPSGYMIERLAQRFGVTTRSVYRYINVLQELGFEIEKHGDRYRMILRRDAQLMMPLFSSEETDTLRDSVLAIHDRHPLKPTLLKKLRFFSDTDFIAEIIEDHITAGHIKSLIQAIREKKQIWLRHYSSPNSQTTRDRLVEPIRFSSNLRYLYAYEPELKSLRQFKPERIGKTEITKHTFNQTAEHTITSIDAFGMNGQPRTFVQLKLSQRARHLLTEEFPEVNPLPSHEVTQLTVHGFEGIGRFVLGLPGEIEVLGPERFVGYLKTKQKQYTW